MGFRNDIIGGAAALIRAAIQSPNYVTGSAGWQVRKDGSAEFNNLTIRGTFLGTGFIINSSGIFLYSGTPALGNLVGSWAPVAAGTDSFGNAYQKDLAVYAAVNTGYADLSSTGGIGGNTALLFFPGSTAHVTVKPQAYGASNNSGAANEEEYLALTSGKASGNDDTQLQLISKSADATIPAVLNFLIGGSVLSQLFKTQWNIGVTISATAGTPSSPTLITTDSWHAMALSANWSTIAGQPIPSYKYGIEKRVHVTGAAQFNVNINNTGLATGLAAPYQPLTQIYIAPAPGSAGLQVSSNGGLVASQIPGAATAFCNFDGSYPLDL